MKLFFWILCLILSVDGSAQSLSYQARGAGLHLMDMEASYQVREQGYAAAIRTQTRGLLGTLLDAQTTFSSKGKIKDNQFVIEESLIDTLRGKKRRTRAVSFADKPGFQDYATVFLDRVLTPELATKSYRVFDGRRDLLITFAYQGEVPASARMRAFAPAWAYYTVHIEVLAGKSKGWFFNRMGDDSSPPLHLYFGRVQGFSDWVLIQADFDTNLFGTISIRLTEAAAD